MKHLLFITISLLGACSSIKHDVEPRLVAAGITVNPTEPDQLATLDWTLGFVASEQQVVELRSAALVGDREGEPYSLELDLAFPDYFDGKIVPGSEESIRLVNQGVTNEELASLCNANVDQDLAAFLQIGYSDASSEATHTPFTTMRYSLGCVTSN